VLNDQRNRVKKGVLGRKRKTREKAGEKPLPGAEKVMGKIPKSPLPDDGR